MVHFYKLTSQIATYSSLVEARLRPVIGWLPFTFGGAFFCFVSILLIRYFGIARTDFILIVIGAMGIAMSIIGLCLTLGAGWIVWRRTRVLADAQYIVRVGAEHRWNVPIEVPWWIPLLQIRWTWQTPMAAVRQQDTEEVVVLRRRGIWDQVRREIEVGDAFGICRVSFFSTQPAMVRAVPEIKLNQLPTILQGLRGGGDQAQPLGHPSGDRIDIRNYAVGDPVRYILWKVYARTGELVVRTPEKAFEPVKRLLAYLIVHPADQAAASLATSILISGSLGDNWAFGVDGHQGACTDLNTAQEAILQSGCSILVDGSGLLDFVAQEEEVSSLLIFAPPVVGEWVDKVLELSATIPITVCIVGRAPIEGNTWTSWMFMEEAPEHLDQIEIAMVGDILTRLQPSGIACSIVEMDSERSYSGTEFLRQYGEKYVENIARRDAV